MSLFCWTQRKILWRMWETEQFWGTIDFHCIFSPKFKQHFFKISSFVFSRTNTFIQVWNYLRVSKRWHNFHFWVNNPFRATCLCINLFCSDIIERRRIVGELFARVYTCICQYAHLWKYLAVISVLSESRQQGKRTRVTLDPGSS